MLKKLTPILSATTLALSLQYTQAAEVVTDRLETSFDEAYTPPQCLDERGVEVGYANTKDHDIKPWAINIGARYLDHENIENPVIAYTPQFVKSLSKLEWDFTREHECFHFTSGDARKLYKILVNSGEKPERKDFMEIEDNADCHALDILLDELGYSLEDTKALVTFFKRGVGDYADRAQSRYDRALACYNEKHEEVPEIAEPPAH